VAEDNGTTTTQTPGTETPPAETPPAAPAAPELASLWQDEGLRTRDSLVRYKTVDELGKAYIELERKVGEKPQGLLPPGDDATDEQRQAFYRQLPGYPTAPDQYHVQPPELPPEAGQWQAPFVQQFLTDVAHPNGFTQGQVQAVFDFYASFIQQSVQAQRDLDSTQINDAYDTLRTRWGPNTDTNLLIADEHLRRRFGEQDPWWDTLIQRQDGKAVPLKNLPGFIEMAWELGQRHGHDKFVLGDGAGGFLTPELATQRLEEAYAKHGRKAISDAELSDAINRYQPIISSRQGQAGR
jgi:hypothetical protein